MCSFYGEICSRTTKATTNLIIAAINVSYLERITQTIIDFIYVPYKMEQRHKRGKGEGKSAKRRPIKARPFSYFRHISNISQLCNVSCVVSRYWLQMISFAEFSQFSLLQRSEPQRMVMHGTHTGHRKIGTAKQKKAIHIQKAGQIIKVKWHQSKNVIIKCVWFVGREHILAFAQISETFK